MPFVQRVITPIYLSRTSLFAEDGKPLVHDQELEAVTNNTLSNALRQLASLASIADDIFTELSQHLQEVAKRSETLKARIKVVEDKVNGYDPKAVTVPESDICTFARLKKHYAAKIATDTSLFTSETRPRALRDLYEAANKTPVHLMRQMDRWRRDGHRTSRFFLCTPILGEKRRKIRNIDIETRMPASVKDLRRWTSSEALGDVTVAPDCPNRIVPNVTLTEFELSDGIVSDDEPIDHKLPSPEEQLQVVALKFPAEMVAVDVSGRSFDRMSVQRRSLLTGKVEETLRTRTRSRKPRGRRRNTLAGTDQKEIREALTAADSPTSSTAATQSEKTVGRSKSSDLLRPLKRESPETKKSHFNTLKQWGRNRYDRFRNKACSTSPEASRPEDIDDFNIYETVTMKRKRSVEKHVRSPSVSSSEKSAAIPVKLRESSAQRRLKRIGSKEEQPHSSSGNWSASSIGSEFTTTTQPKSTTSAATSINSLNQPNSVPSRRRFNINTSTSSSVTSEGTLTPDIIHDLHEDGETSSVYSCDTEGYYTSFHMDSGLKTLKEEELPCTPLHSTSAVGSLTAENEYELFGKGSTSTTTSSAGTVCTTLMASDSSRSLNKCPAVPERKSSLPKYKQEDQISPESSLERTGTVKRSPKASVVVGVVHKGDISPDSGHNTSSSPIESANSPTGIRSGSEFEFSESSDMEGPERTERIRIKTTINSSRIPSMCVITPQQSDDESTNSDNQEERLKRIVDNQVLSINVQSGYATLDELDVNKNSKTLRAASPSGGTVTVLEATKPQQPIIKATLLPLNNMLGKIKNLANLTRKDKSPNRVAPQEDSGDYVTLADVRNNNEKVPIYSNVAKKQLANVVNNNNNNKIRETEYVSLDELPCNANKEPSNENSLERTRRQGARVTLDAEGKVVYSSDSLKRKTTSSTFEPGPFVKLATGLTQSPLPSHRVPKTRPMSPSMVVRAGNTDVVHVVTPAAIVAPAVTKPAGPLRAGAYVHVQDSLRPAQKPDRVPNQTTPEEMTFRSLDQRGKYQPGAMQPGSFYQTLPAKRNQYFLQDPERSVTPDITRGLERNTQVYSNFYEPPDWHLLNQKLGIPVQIPEVPAGSHFAHISPHKTTIDSVDSIKISPIDPRNSTDFKSSTPSNKTAVNLENLLSSPKKSTMSNEELYAVIHKGKKKMNIESSDESPVKTIDKSKSRLSWSPSKGEYVDFNTDIDNISPQNQSKTRQSWACEPKKTSQTSRMDFKKLLLQKSNVLTSTKKLSAVEQLKLSRSQIQNKQQQQPLNILELSGSPRNLTRKFSNNDAKPAPKLMSPRSQWRFANPRTDVLSSTILEDCREDESPNNSLEKQNKDTSSPKSYSSITQRMQAQRAQFFKAPSSDSQERPALETAF